MKVHIMICLLVVSVSLLISSAAYPASVTLRQGHLGYTGTTDSWLNDGAESRNYGGSPELEIEFYNGHYSNVVLRFELAGQIPQYQRVLYASLTLLYTREENFSSDEVMTITPFRLTASWEENDGPLEGRYGEGTSWRYRDIAEENSWTSQFGAWYDKEDDENGTARIQAWNGEDPTAIKPYNPVTWNVTNSVSKWYQGTESNYGFLVAATGLTNGTRATGVFRSRNGSVQGERPMLYIVYEGALLPVAEANGPYFCDYMDSVDLSGVGSHDPDGGDITAYDWDLDLDGYYDDAFGIGPNVTWDYLVNTLGLPAGEESGISLRVTDDEGEYGYDGSVIDIADFPIPEPFTAVLAAVGLIAVLLRRRS